jgi:mono/diheme cytochrome c family protein
VKDKTTGISMIPTVNTTKQNAKQALACVLAISALAALPLGGCRGDRTDQPPRRFFPDMDYQPKLKPQSETEFFEDGKSQRNLVDGTVPFAAHGVLPQEGDTSEWAQMREMDRAGMLKDDETFYFGLVAGSDPENPTYVDRMPAELTQEMIARGAERYNIFCGMCHGYDALGNDSGTVGRLMNVRPVNLLDAKYRDRNGEFGTDGYLFHVIREGLWSPDGTNRMPAYGHAIDEQDAWAIVGYIRVLQAAFDAEGKSIVETTTSTTDTDGGEG